MSLFPKVVGSGAPRCPGGEEGRCAEPAPGVVTFTSIGDPEPRRQPSGQRLTTEAPGYRRATLCPERTGQGRRARFCRTRSERAPCCKGATARLRRPLGSSRGAAPRSRAREAVRVARVAVSGGEMPGLLVSISQPWPSLLAWGLSRLPFPFLLISRTYVAHRWRGLLGALQLPLPFTGVNVAVCTKQRFP